MNTRRFVQGFHRWKIVFSVIIGIQVIFEIARVVARYAMINKPGYLSPFLLNIAVVLACLAVIGFTWGGQKKAPLFMTLVLVYNFFTTSIVSYTDIGMFGMFQDYIFGMSTTLFNIYLLVQLVLIVALVAYYFTDYLFGDDTSPRSEQRALAFDEYLKKQAEEKNLAEDSGIWRD